jgi:hypothetical protein
MHPFSLLSGLNRQRLDDADKFSGEGRIYTRTAEDNALRRSGG